MAAVRDSAQLVVTALEMLLESPAREQHPVGRLLQRGYLLEVAAGLRAASDGLPARMQRQTVTLCDRLAHCREVDAALRSQAAMLLAGIRKLVSFEDASLAHRLRAAIETSPSRMTIADLAHACGTNARYASQAFRRELARRSRSIGGSGSPTKS